MITECLKAFKTIGCEAVLSGDDNVAVCTHWVLLLGVLILSALLVGPLILGQLPCGSCPLCWMTFPIATPKQGVQRFWRVWASRPGVPYETVNVLDEANNPGVREASFYS